MRPVKLARVSRARRAGRHPARRSRSWDPSTTKALMSHDWPRTALESEDDVLHVLADLQGKGWLSRGHQLCHASLVPSIDRGPLSGLPRVEKLERERQAINQFRSTARFFSSPGEQSALLND